MTEEEWLSATDPQKMLFHLGDDKINARKARLFGCCIRHRVWPHLSDERSRVALDVSERFADGLATEDELAVARRGACDVAEALQGEDNQYQPAAAMLWATSRDVSRNLRAGLKSAEQEGVCAWLRDIFGNPFHPITLDPTWLTSTVIALAHQMYETRDFTVMPILADALQDAGCEKPEILDHCHSERRHTKGCWCVDLLLGKS